MPSPARGARRANSRSSTRCTATRRVRSRVLRLTFQTADLVPAARLRPGREIESPPRGVGGAPTGARVQRHPSGLPRQTRVTRVSRGRPGAEAQRLASFNGRTRASRRSAVAIFGRGPRFRLQHYPPQPVQRCSSQPGRSAWRAVSRTSRVSLRLRAAVAGRHSLLRLQDRL